jgi:hypothetical protein
VRRFVDLSRPQLLTLLAASPTLAAAQCHEDVRQGAPFRIHRDTVTRDFAVSVYSARANAMATVGASVAGAAEAIGALATIPLDRIRLGAVDGRSHYALFLDPEAIYLIACLGVEPNGGLTR